MFGGMGGKAEDRACAKEGGKESEQEIEAQFGCVAKNIVGDQGLPGTPDDHAKRNALKVPERAEGGMRNQVPDALMSGVGGLIETVIGTDDSVAWGAELARSKLSR